MTQFQITSLQLKKMAIAYLMILNIKRAKGNQTDVTPILTELNDTELLLKIINLNLPICISND